MMPLPKRENFHIYNYEMIPTNLQSKLCCMKFEPKNKTNQIIIIKIVFVFKFFLFFSLSYGEIINFINEAT